MKHTTLITDFDNTLYDWFHMWHQSFTAMLEEIVRKSGINRETLIREIRSLHQKYGTSEYAFLIEEIPSLQNAYRGKNLTAEFDDAVHAYRRARKRSLVLYEGVRDTLLDLRASNVKIVLYTESLAYYTNFRVRRLELDELIDVIYSPPDHALPTFTTSHTQRDEAQLTHALHRYLPNDVVKPNPEVLLDIVKEIGCSPPECVYLGDSLMKDVAMAQDAGILDVYASYGGVQHREEYELLRQVSHWTDVNVKRETQTSLRTITPTKSISKFSEVSSFFECW